MNLPGTQARSLVGEFDPGRQGRAAGEQLDVDAAEGRPAIAPDRIPARAPGVRRERGLYVPDVSLPRQPGNGDGTAPRAEHRPVHGARGKLPAVVVHGFRLRPRALLEA